jgi:hypothetical protein
VDNWVDASATTTVQDGNNYLTVAPTPGDNPPVEGAGTLTNRLRVSAGGFVSNAVTVQLISSNPTKVTVPPAVVIPAGQQFVYTNITFPDDSLFDGTQTVIVMASSDGFTPGSLTLTVPDNDVHHFTFATVSPSQTSGVPFRVTVTAKDVNDVVLTFFSGSVSLSALPAGTPVTVSPLSISNFLRGSWSGNVTVIGWGTNLQLIATAANGRTSLSNPFTIPPPPWVQDLRVSRLQFDGSGLQLFFNSYTGHVYQVEFTTNLPPAWTPIGPSQPGTDAELSVIDSDAPTQPTRFYRLSATP